MQNLQVPSWRVKVFTSCYTMEGTENLSDDVFDRRHSRLEIDERRRKRYFNFSSVKEPYKLIFWVCQLCCVLPKILNKIRPFLSFTMITDNQSNILLSISKNHTSHKGYGFGSEKLNPLLSPVQSDCTCRLYVLCAWYYFCRRPISGPVLLDRPVLSPHLAFKPYLLSLLLGISVNKEHIWLMKHSSLT